MFKIEDGYSIKENKNNRMLFDEDSRVVRATSAEAMMLTHEHLNLINKSGNNAFNGNFWEKTRNFHYLFGILVEKNIPVKEKIQYQRNMLNYAHAHNRNEPLFSQKKNENGTK